MVKKLFFLFFHIILPALVCSLKTIELKMYYFFGNFLENYPNSKSCSLFLLFKVKITSYKSSHVMFVILLTFWKICWNCRNEVLFLVFMYIFHVTGGCFSSFYLKFLIHFIFTVVLSNEISMVFSELYLTRICFNVFCFIDKILNRPLKHSFLYIYTLFFQRFFWMIAKTLAKTTRFNINITNV